MLGLSVLVLLAVILGVGSWVFWRVESEMEALERVKREMERERARLERASGSPSYIMLCARDEDGQVWPVGFRAMNDTEIRH